MKMNFKRLASAATFIALTSAGMQDAMAVAVTRAQFGSSAVTQGFESGTVGQVSFSEGQFSVEGGTVQRFSNFSGFNGNAYSGDPYQGGTLISFSPLAPMSALGMSFIASGADVTLSLLDFNRNLLEKLTIDWRTLPKVGGIPMGFIGISYGQPVVVYASITSSAPFAFDDVIYQSEGLSAPPPPVPEPSTWALWSVGGLAALALRGRRRNRA